MKIENNNTITEENYFLDKEYISASMVKQALQGSKKQFDYAMQQNIETEAMLVGSAFHAMMLEPEEFKKLYAFEPEMDRRTKAGKEYIAEWKEQNKHILHHIPGKYESMLINMQESLNAHPRYKELVVQENGKFEEICLFELNNVKCKAKVDYYNTKNNYIVDIKTCQSINIDAILESIKKYMYAVQAAFYLDGLKAHKFYFVFIEKKAPYDVLVIDFVTALEDGRKAYTAGIKNIKSFEELEVEGYHMFNRIVQL